MKTKTGEEIKMLQMNRIIMDQLTEFCNSTGCEKPWLGKQV